MVLGAVGLVVVVVAEDEGAAMVASELEAWRSLIVVAIGPLKVHVLKSSMLSSMNVVVCLPANCW